MIDVTEATSPEYNQEQLGSKLYIEYNNLPFPLHEKETFNAQGYLVKIEYYSEYDGITYNNLMYVKNIVTINNAMGIPERRDVSYEFYINGELANATRNETMYFNISKGIKLNKKAFEQVFNDASLYMIQTIGLNEAKSLLNSLSSESSLYRLGSRDTLLSAIANSTNPLLTPSIKSTLDTILNVIY